MKKKLLLILPVLFGFLITSCNNDPKPEPIKKQDFVQNLNNIKKQATVTDTFVGLEANIKNSLETTISYNQKPLTFKLLTNSNIKVNNKKISSKNSISAKGTKLEDGNPKNMNASLEANIYGELLQTEANILLDASGSTNIPGESQNANRKIKTTVPLEYDEGDIEEIKNSILSDYHEFTQNYIDEALNELQNIPLAKCGYAKKDDVEVFTVNFDFAVDTLTTNSTSLKLRFDKNYITNYDYKSEITTSQNGIASVTTTTTSISVSEYSKDIKLPNASDYEMVKIEEFEKLLPNFED